MMKPENAVKHLLHLARQFTAEDHDATQLARWPAADDTWAEQGPAAGCLAICHRYADHLWKRHGIEAVPVHLADDPLFAGFATSVGEHVIVVALVGDFMIATDLCSRIFYNVQTLDGHDLFDPDTVTDPLVWLLEPGWHGHHPLLGDALQTVLPWG
ncbi:hypothetical protein ACFC1T_08850 [Kitasatospora sp. NPDC056076]|uniref:hypothetical protein n=1 Tax=Kitasatospora sp. NPDC056076 TaxID=3345703 RepID=UPI0035DD4FF0